MTTAVLGAGSSGRAWSSHLSLLGHDVHLWSRSASKGPDSAAIRASGAVQGTAVVRLTSDLEKCIKGAQLIIVATPATAHARLATALTSLDIRLPPILLSPGRTLGCFDFLAHCAKRRPVVAEAQTVLHTSRFVPPDAVHFFTIKDVVEVAGLSRAEAEEVIAQLPEKIGSRFRIVDSWVRTSFGNIGAVLHPTPMLMNAARVEGPAAFRFYADGITPAVVAVMNQVDEERRAVAEALGVTVPSLALWFSEAYGRAGPSVEEVINLNPAYQFIDAPTTLYHRYVTEDVCCGLVPMEAVGKRMGVKTSAISTIINLADIALTLRLRDGTRGDALVEKILHAAN